MSPDGATYTEDNSYTGMCGSLFLLGIIPRG